MHPSPTILIPRGLPLLLCSNDKRQLRRMVCVFIHLKALYKEGRFKFTERELLHITATVGFKATHTKTIKAWLYRLDQKQLIKKQEGCIYLANWETLLELLQLPKKRYYEFTLSATQTVEDVLFQLAWQAEKQHFENCQQANVKADAQLQYHLKSVSDKLSATALHQCQLDMFCNLPPGTFDGEFEWLLLYASKKGRKFLYKADTHISIQHLSQRFGYAGANGFCYRKKKLQQAGLIAVTRREYEVRKSFRTSGIARQTGIGTFFYDRSTGTQKLRLVDAVEFIKPGLSITGTTQSTGAQPANQAA